MFLNFNHQLNSLFLQKINNTHRARTKAEVTSNPLSKTKYRRLIWTQWLNWAQNKIFTSLYSPPPDDKDQLRPCVLLPSAKGAGYIGTVFKNKALGRNQ